MMETYIDKLAPWERRNAYYKDVKLGDKELKELRTILKNQTQEMITTKIASTGGTILNHNSTADVINETGYDLKNIGKGMNGLQAAFEWGISDVVWLFEKNTEEMQRVLVNLYKIPDRQLDDLKYKADTAFTNGDIENALERYLELDSFLKDDFSICISIGIIYLFHKIDKKKALSFFERAIRYARPFSPYYTSYALLYKALIQRDFGLIEEAVKHSSEAVRISPGLTEAKYQNAQYKALLNRPEEVIPLITKVINNDVLYCLKISCEQDFKQISPDINALFEDIRGKKNRKVKETLVEAKKNVTLLSNAVKNIEKFGHSVPEESSVEILENGIREIEELIQNNSIIDAHIAEILFPLLVKKLKRNKELIKRRGNEIHLSLDRQIEMLSKGMVGKKKKGGSLSFFIHFFGGQIIALPFGWYIGVPLGMVITEGLLLAICIYLNILLPKSQWKEVNARQNEQDKLSRVMKKL